MKKPDELVVEIERSIFAKALVISVIAHIVLLGVTSVSLFKDWASYGVHSPSYINSVKSQERRDAEEAARRAAVAEKAAAAEAAKQTESGKAAESANDKSAAKPAADAKAQPTAKTTPAVEAVKDKTPPEVQPLPPKKGFEYGDDLSLE